MNYKTALRFIEYSENILFEINYIMISKLLIDLITDFVIYKKYNVFLFLLIILLFLCGKYENSF